MISHLNPSSNYIRQILINSECHGYCYPTGSPAVCDFINCTLYHNRIKSEDGTLNVTLVYDQTENVDEPCHALAQASISLEPIGTGR